MDEEDEALDIKVGVINRGGSLVVQQAKCQSVETTVLVLQGEAID